MSEISSLTGHSDDFTKYKVVSFPHRATLLILIILHKGKGRSILQILGESCNIRSYRSDIWR